MPDLIIRNEDDAISYLKSAIDGTLSTSEAITIRFEDWPHLKIRLIGNSFNTPSVTTTTMKCLVDFQTAVYRAYAALKYNQPNVALLTHEEKESLELTVHVDEGSTILGIDLQKLMESAVQATVGKMSGTQAVIVVLGISTLFAGTVAYKDYIHNKTETRREEIANERQSEILRAVTHLTQEETRHLEIVTSALIANPVLQSVKVEADNAKHSLIKMATQATTTEVQGTSISADVAGELVKTKRETAAQRRLDDIYYIQVFDSKTSDTFKVNVRKARTNEEFVAIVQDETSNNRIITAIQQAQRNRSLVTLTINAWVLRGTVRQAVISDAVPFEGQVTLNKSSPTP